MTIPHNNLAQKVPSSAVENQQKIKPQRSGSIKTGTKDSDLPPFRIVESDGKTFFQDFEHLAPENVVINPPSLFGDLA